MPAYVSTVAEQLQQLMLARNWQCKTSRFTVEAVDPATLDPIRYVWLAGQANAISEGEVKSVRPSRIIVPDATSRSETGRLGTAMSAIGVEPIVETLTRFIDFLWDAPAAAERARKDAKLYDALGILEPAGGHSAPSTRHVPQT